MYKKNCARVASPQVTIYNSLQEIIIVLMSCGRHRYAPSILINFDIWQHLTKAVAVDRATRRL